MKCWRKFQETYEPKARSPNPTPICLRTFILCGPEWATSPQEKSHHVKCVELSRTIPEYLCLFPPFLSGPKEFFLFPQAIPCVAVTTSNLSPFRCFFLAHRNLRSLANFPSAFSNSFSFPCSPRNLLYCFSQTVGFPCFFEFPSVGWWVAFDFICFAVFSHIPYITEPKIKFDPFSPTLLPNSFPFFVFANLKSTETCLVELYHIFFLDAMNLPRIHSPSLTDGFNT